jgi:molecular chaperone GrpE (heat shock protein)
LKVFTQLNGTTKKEWLNEENYKYFKNFVIGIKMTQKDFQHALVQKSVEKARRLLHLC